MLTSQRRDFILKILHEDSAVTVSKLTELFGVSTETIRKDLLNLEKAGQLTRVHGGAVMKNDLRPFYEFEKRADEHRREKQELSQLAVGLVEENDIIGIDSGTTSLEFAQALVANFQSLTIVTYSLEVFDRVRQRESFNVILCGGNYLKSERAFCGILSHKLLEDIHLRKAFIFPSAVSLKNGVCDHHPQLLEMQRRLVMNSDRVIIMADSSKYEKNALYKICTMSPNHIYVSNSALPKSVKELYKENQCHIITGKDDIDESNLNFS